MLRFDEVVAVLRERIERAQLIAIDGLPVSGKSTLAARLASTFDLDILPFDDFVLPRRMRQRSLGPAYPFPYFRVDDFRSAVRDLRQTGTCTYLPFDWKTGRLSRQTTTLARRGPVIVEGCATLDPLLADHYDLRLFVESDRATTFAARTLRDGQSDVMNWRELYLPSADLYLATDPRSRADFLVAGRGV
ncbi:hypothetical protein XM25_10980 [Devosia sp. H5989]|nr:hypothetical protein XM25_10980 [Devosia sp. H5989]